ncbi:MAG: hypothetical protein M3R00_08265 [Pseudomonadota bacterium]|nr:hypothetical protein [Pseudomonadota bacterium]
MVAVDCVLKRDAIEKILTHLKIDPHPPPRGIPYEANLHLVYEAAN